MYLLWEFLGFPSGAVEVFVLLACGATSLDDWRHHDLRQRHMAEEWRPQQSADFLVC
jgi:hypothetical protein